MSTSATVDAHHLTHALGCPVTPLAQADHHNRHFSAVAPNGRRLFVKLSTAAPKYHDAEVRAGTHLAGVPVTVPPMVDHGRLDPGRAWIAYEWQDLHPFPADLPAIESAGRALGTLHERTWGLKDDQLRRFSSIADLLDEKLRLVAEIDQPLADRLARLRKRLRPGEQAFAVFGDERCLLHGDVGWRNLALDPHYRCILFDFEHAAVGPAILDFAKLWDRELAEQEVRDTFLRGYRALHPVDLETWHAAIGAVRLWAAAGIFPYARPRGDFGFETHARLIVERLEQ